ncbi:MAG: hypothetical protein ACRD3K_08365, partial [Edaphobacter sp.]
MGVYQRECGAGLYRRDDFCGWLVCVWNFCAALEGVVGRAGFGLNLSWCCEFVTNQNGDCA